MQHCRVPSLQVSLAAIESGAAATTEERVRTGKRKADTRMNIFTEFED